MNSEKIRAAIQSNLGINSTTKRALDNLIGNDIFVMAVPVSDDFSGYLREKTIHPHYKKCIATFTDDIFAMYIFEQNRHLLAFVAALKENDVISRQDKNVAKLKFTYLGEQVINPIQQLQDFATYDM